VYCLFFFGLKCLWDWALVKDALLTVKNTPLSKDVFGHFLEYKVYEYFIQNLFDKKFQ